MEVIIAVAVVFIVAIVAFYIISRMGLDGDANNIARIIVGVLALIALFAVLFGYYPHGYIHSW